MQAVRVAMVTPVDGARHVDRDLGAARALFEETCTMCHELDDVEHYPFQPKRISRTCWSAWSTTVSKSPPRGRKRSRGT
jgi:cytochrome c5